MQNTSDPELNVTEVTTGLGTERSDCSGHSNKTLELDNSSGDVERPRGDRGHQHTDTEERTLLFTLHSSQNYSKSKMG